MTELTKACGGGGSSLGAAVEDVSVNRTNDTLIEAMLLFHCEGEETCIRKFPQYGGGAISIIKHLQSKAVLLALGNYDAEMVEKELHYLITLPSECARVLILR